MLYSRSTLESFYTVPEPNSNPISNTTSSDSKRFSPGNSHEQLLPPNTHRRVISNPFEIIYDPEVASVGAQLPTDTRSLERLKSPGYLDIERTIDQGHAHRRNRSSQIFSAEPSPKSKTYNGEETLTPTTRIQSTLPGSRIQEHPEIPPVVTIIGDQSILRRGNSVISSGASLRHRNSIRNRSKMVKKTDLQPVAAVDISPQTSPKRPTRKLRFTFPVRRQRSLKRNPNYQPLSTAASKFETAHDLYSYYFNNDGPRMIRELLPPSMLSFAYSKFASINPTLHLSLRRTKMDNTFTSIFIDANDKTQISAPIEGTFKKNDIPIINDPEVHYDLSRAIFDKYRNAVFANKVKNPATFYDIFPEEVENSLVTPEDAEFFTTKLYLEVLLRRTVAAKINYRLKGTRMRNFNTSSDSAFSQDSDSNGDGGNLNKHESLPKLSSDSGNSDSESVNTDDLMQQNASLYSGLLPSPQISYSSNIFGSDFDLAPALEKRSTTASPRAIHNFGHNDEIPDRNLFQQDSYRLQPMNRSMATLTSTDDSVTPVDIASTDKLLTIDSEVRNSSSSKEGSSRELSSEEKRRKSLSTARLSLLNDLDGLTSELSSFINEEALELGQSPDDDQLPPIKTNQRIPQVSTKHVDVTSQKASIYAASTCTSPSKNHHESDMDSQFLVARREDSISTRSAVSTVKHN
ncbi:hypothetical protein QFC19_000260 [Naganishia cerealis]|uniref:Uncharacterized protein n=1 Tax=Naganishia cerealis TaxID=610337 RepID=A0ACC2WS24_9TREE|nr:hypothetical protein QFC19_000260 [Naganishia cerealis]